MIKLMYFILVLLVTSCMKDDITEDSDGVPVNINFAKSDIIDVKSGEDDVNIYFYNKKLKYINHHYSKTRYFVINLVEGDYDIFTIAGYGSDMGERTYLQLESLSASGNETDALNYSERLFTRKTTSTIKNSTPLNIELQRLTTKLIFNIAISPSYAFVPEYMEVVNAPTAVSFFSDNISTAGQTYKVSRFNTAPYKYECFVFENLKGVVNSIGDQRNKSRENAPLNSTYLHIVGKERGKVLHYYVFMGINNYSDFNLRRNNILVNNITISGYNEIDNRISIIDSNIGDLNALYKVDEVASSTLKLVSDNEPTRKVWLQYTQAEGTGIFKFNGTTVASGGEIAIATGSVNWSKALTYTQSTEGNYRASVTITDKKEFSYTKLLTTTFEEDAKFTAEMNIPTEGVCRKPINMNLKVLSDKYVGSYTLKYELKNSLSNIASETSINGTAISNNGTTTINNGDQTFDFTPLHIGTYTLKITITNDKGISNVITGDIAVTPTTLWIEYTANASYIRNNTMSVVGNDYPFPCYVDIRFESSIDMPVDFTFTGGDLVYYVRDIDEVDELTSPIRPDREVYAPLQNYHISKGQRYSYDNATDYEVYGYFPPHGTKNLVFNDEAAGGDTSPPYRNIVCVIWDSPAPGTGTTIVGIKKKGIIFTGIKTLELDSDTADNLQTQVGETYTVKVSQK